MRIDAAQVGLAGEAECDIAAGERADVLDRHAGRQMEPAGQAPAHQRQRFRIRRNPAARCGCAARPRSPVANASTPHTPTASASRSTGRLRGRNSCPLSRDLPGRTNRPVARPGQHRRAIPDQRAAQLRRRDARAHPCGRDRATSASPADPGCWPHRIRSRRAPARRDRHPNRRGSRPSSATARASSRCARRSRSPSASAAARARPAA